MSTTISTPSANNAKMRWMEPYVSDGLNAKMNGLVPAGVVRGGKLVTGGAGLLVTVQADPIFGDSIYSYIDSNGRQLTFKQAGDVTLDLDVGGVPGTTVYIGLEITYVISSATLVYWKAYSEAEVNADPYIVVLGRVVVPALPGPIPSANVTPRKRRDAWLTTSPGMRDWVQLVINGSFDNAAAGQITSSDEDEPPLWDSKNIAVAGLRYDIDQTNPRSGHNCLKLTGDGANTVGSVLWNERYAAVRPGQMMRASMWVKGVGVSAGGLGPAGAGYLVLRVNFVTKDYVSVASWMACNASDLDGNFDYTELTEMIEVPATAAWAYWGVYTNDWTNTMTGSYYVDDVRLWLESGPPQEDDIRERLLIEGEPSLRGLDIAPWGTALASYADGLAKTLRLRFDAIVSSVMEYEWKHRQGSVPWLLKLVGGTLQPGAFPISGIADAIIPRIKSIIPASATSKYTLLWSMDNLGSAGDIRVYASDSNIGGVNAYVVTINAEWYDDGASGKWRYDSAGYAGRFDITASGFRQFTKNTGGTSPWIDADWNDATESWNYLELIRQADGRSSLGIQGLIELLGTYTQADLEIPRIRGTVGDNATNTYTLLAEFNSEVAARVSIRVYLAIGTGSASLLITVNASWDDSASNWVLDVTTENATKYTFSYNGLSRISTRYWNEGGAGGAPFTDWIEQHEFNSDVVNKLGKHYLYNGRLVITDAGAFTNPNWNSAVDPNALYAKNIVKAWAFFTVDGGVVSVGDGFGLDSITLDGSGYVVIDFDEDFDNTNYAIVLTPWVGITTDDWSEFTPSAGNCSIVSVNRGTGAIHNLTTYGNIVGCSVIIIGEHANTL